MNRKPSASLQSIAVNRSSLSNTFIAKADCHFLRAFNLFSTNPINSPAEIPSPSARLKIVASAGAFSARSSALIWLRSVSARSASWSWVRACCKRSSCNTSPNTVVGNFLFDISWQVRLCQRPCLHTVVFAMMPRYLIPASHQFEVNADWQDHLSVL